MSQRAGDAAVPDDEAAAVGRAMAALEEQRASLGDAVVDTALGPLRRRLDELRHGLEQRRHVTVLFADLVGFTALSERLDAEDVRAILQRYFDRWLRVVTEHGGAVEKFIGDAVMAVFGLHRSSEDDPQRAVRAALEMLAQLESLNDGIEAEHGVRLAARVGVDSGPVVVSTLGERDGAGFVAVGPAVNRASRLQAAAPPGRVLVSPDTHRLIRGAFATEPLPGLRLKGVRGEVDAHLVRGRLGSGFRLERAAPVEGLVTATVGRGDAADALRRSLREVGEQRVHRVVTVAGEAGIGKTRLLYDFDEWLLERPDEMWWFRGRASPASRGSAGALLRDVVAARLGLRLDDGRETVRRRFEDAFTEILGRDGVLAARLVAAWLRFLPPTGDLPTDPLALRDRGTAALAGWFEALTRWGSVVLLLEDLHWADDESLRWLDAVAPLLQHAPVLVVASTRPALFETRPDWGAGAHHVRLELGALSRRDSRALVDQLLSRVEAPPAALVELLLEQGDGSPFYLEELVGWLVDAGVIVRDEPRWRIDPAHLQDVPVPPTLRGVLQSRLDALGTGDRAALQRAAVIGRVFWDTAVDSLDRQPDRTGALDRLTAREVVLRREVSRFGGAREFAFKHALLRDVAYDAVLRRTRERHHLAAARWLERTSEGARRSEEYAAVIAGHLERARDAGAGAWYVRAAVQAAAVHASAEAHALLDAAERASDPADATTRFDAALTREALHERAGDREGQAAALAALDGWEAQVDDARRARLLLARARWSFIRSDYPPALVAAADAARVAQRSGLADLAAEAVLVEGKTRTWLDEVDAARALLERAAGATAPAVVAEARRYLCILDGNVGRFGTALEHGRAARAMFAAIGDAEMEAMAHAQTATLLYKTGRFAEAQTVLEESVPIFRRAGHRYREVMATANLASVAIMRGDFGRALPSAAAAVDDLRAMGDREATAVALITLAVARMLTGGDPRDALDEAVAIAQEVGNPTLQTDAIARRSHAALLRGDHATAVREARHAVDVAGGAPSDLDRATAQLALGHALLADADPQGAAAAFAGAAALVADLDTRGPDLEAAVGAAAASADGGRAAEAAGAVERVLPELTPDRLAGVQLPGLTLLQAVTVLESAGVPAATTAREAARRYLREVRAMIDDDALAEGFAALPPHAALLGR